MTIRNSFRLVPWIEAAMWSEVEWWWTIGLPFADWTRQARKSPWLSRSSDWRKAIKRPTSPPRCATPSSTHWHKISFIITIFSGKVFFKQKYEIKIHSAQWKIVKIPSGVWAAINWDTTAPAFQTNSHNPVALQSSNGDKSAGTISLSNSAQKVILPEELSRELRGICRACPRTGCWPPRLRRQFFPIPSPLLDAHIPAVKAEDT